MILFLSNGKSFEPKILVPRDIPGVTGAPISGGCNSRISPTSVSGHIGSIQQPWHRGMPRTCQRTKTFSMTVWDNQGLIKSPKFFLIF